MNLQQRIYASLMTDRYVSSKDVSVHLNVRSSQGGVRDPEGWYVREILDQMEKKGLVVSRINGEGKKVYRRREQHERRKLRSTQTDV